MLSQVHQFLFLYIAPFDVCVSCYNNKDPSAIEIEDHTIDHPVVKWTLDPLPPVREWIESVAKVVLEDLQAVGERVGGNSYEVVVVNEGGNEKEEGANEEEEDEEDEEEGGNEEEEGGGQGQGRGGGTE